jgi:hypothetical protein
MTCLETKEQEVKKTNNMLLGNAIELVTTKTGIKKVVDKVSEKTGRDCGCAARKAKLNNPNLLINKILK